MTRTPTDLLLSSGLPAQPGSLWAMLSRLAWADPELCRPEVITLTANLSGAVNGLGVPVDGSSVPAEEATVAHMYFLCDRLTGYVVADPTDPLEATLAEYVYVQLQDQERKRTFADTSFNLGEIAATRARVAQPMDFAGRPLTWLPTASIRANFTPKAGFPVANPHSMTTLVTREVGVILSGLLIDKDLVENLLDGNKRVLNEFGLLRRGR